MPEITNAKRAEWAGAAVRRFRSVCKGDMGMEAIGDLMVNLMHLARLHHGVEDMEHFLKIKLQTYEEERTEDPDDERDLALTN